MAAASAPGRDRHKHIPDKAVADRPSVEAADRETAEAADTPSAEAADRELVVVADTPSAEVADRPSDVPADRLSAEAADRLSAEAATDYALRAQKFPVAAHMAIADDIVCFLA